MSIDRNKVLEAAQKHLAKGNLDKAIAEFQKLVQADPKDVRTLLKVGELQAKKGAIREAVDTYLKVGDSYANQGFFTKSVAVYKQAVKLDTTRLDALKKLAQNYEELQHVADALATYDLLAQANMVAKNVDGALAAMQRATELDPNNLAARIRFAEALSTSGKTAEAAVEFERGAQLIKQQGRMDDYIKVAERLLFHREHDLALAKELAQLYLERNDGKRALGKLQLLFKANPKDDQVLSMLAQAFVSLDQRDKAVQVLKELAKHHLEANRIADRVQVMRRVLELDPNDVEAKQAVSGVPAVVKPKVDVDAVVPATAVIGGGGRAGATAHARTGGAPAVPAPRVAAPQIPAPQIPAPQLQPAAASGVVLPHHPPAPPRPAAPPPAPEPLPAIPSTEFEVQEDDDQVFIVDDEPDTEPTPAPEPVAAAPAPAVAPAPSVQAPPAERPSVPDADAQRRAQAARLLAECEVFARYNLRPRILEQLEKVLAIAPEMVDVRLRLKAIYAEDGRVDDAVEQLLAVAELTKDVDAPQAIAALREVLSLDEENPDARRALKSIDPSLVPGRVSFVPDEPVMFVEDEDEAPAAPPANEPQPRTPSIRPASMRPGATSAETVAAPRPSMIPRVTASLPPVLEDEPEELPSTTLDVELPALSIEIDPNDLSLPPAMRLAGRAPAGALPASAFGGPAGGLPGVPAPAVPSLVAPRVAPDAAAVMTSAGSAAPAGAFGGRSPAAEAPTDAQAPSLPDTTFDGNTLELESTTIEVDASELARPSAHAAQTVVAPLPTAPAPTAAVPAPQPTAPALQAVAPTSPESPEIDAFDLDAPISPDEFERAPVTEAALAPVAASAPRTGPGVEDILDEADFYLAQELWDEARETLRDALAATPNHPLLLEKLSEVDELEAGERPVPVPSAPEAPSDDDDAFALAERLAQSTPDAVEAPTDNIDVEQVFAQFKKGVEQQVDASDAETHYDLGIAYKEMGLLDDAVAEFELAAAKPSKASVSLTMIGLCRSEQGRHAEAITALERGLASPHRDLREELGLRYELGSALELAGRDADALAQFQAICTHDPAFRGAADRAAKLSAKLNPTMRTTTAQDEDELERAFDELIGG